MGRRGRAPRSIASSRGLPMSNALTEIQDEVARLNKERRGEPSPPPVAEAPGQPPAPDAPPTTPVDPGPPRILAISIEQSAVISTIGNFALEAKESREIAKIALKALARNMRETFATVASNHGLEPPSRPGLTSMADLPKSDDLG